MNPQGEYVTLPVSDGSSMRAYVARPAEKPRAGMLVFQEAFGVNAHIRDVTDRFARQGYLAIAPELFHRTGTGVEVGYTDFGAVMPHMRGLTDAGLEADIRAAFDWVQGESKGLPAAAVGYCMGGRTAALAAIAVPLACGISYYGGGIAPSQYFPGLLDRLQNIQGPMLFFWGGLDKHIGPEQPQAVTAAMRAAGKPFVNVEISDADHGFFCDMRSAYNAAAAAEAWALTLAFLDRHLTAESSSSQRASKGAL